jgi:hypothetical protein
VEGKRRLAAFNRHDGQHQHFCLGYKKPSRSHERRGWERGVMRDKELAAEKWAARRLGEFARSVGKSK